MSIEELFENLSEDAKSGLCRMAMLSEMQRRAKDGHSPDLLDIAFGIAEFAECLSAGKVDGKEFVKTIIEYMISTPHGKYADIYKTAAREYQKAYAE